MKANQIFGRPPLIVKLELRIVLSTIYHAPCNMAYVSGYHRLADYSVRLHDRCRALAASWSQVLKINGDKSHSASASASAGGDADDWSFELDNLKFPCLFQHSYSLCPLLVMCCSVRLLSHVQQSIARYSPAPSRASPCRGGEDSLLFQSFPVIIFSLFYNPLARERPSLHTIPRSILKGWSFSSTCTYS